MLVSVAAANDAHIFLGKPGESHVFNGFGWLLSSAYDVLPFKIHAFARSNASCHA